MTDSLLELINIGKYFSQPDGSELAVLRDISLTLSSGESIALMGANGSGKTTLLRIILGELKPTSGRIMLLGKDQISVPVHKRARLVGSVHQESYKSLASDLTVEEILSIAARRNEGLKLRFSDFNSISCLLKELSKGAADFVHDRRKTVTSVLSGGQRQMVAIICSLLGNPKILLLDEHLASLDSDFTDIANKALSRFVKEMGGAYIVVTHDEAWSNSYCDKVSWIRDGRISFSPGNKH